MEKYWTRYRTAKQKLLNTKQDVLNNVMLEEATGISRYTWRANIINGNIPSYKKHFRRLVDKKAVIHFIDNLVNKSKPPAGYMYLNNMPNKRAQDRIKKWSVYNGEVQRIKLSNGRNVYKRSDVNKILKRYEQ